MDNEQKTDLEAVRARLAGKQGRQFWRSLEEVVETEDFQRWVEDEFPHRKSLFDVDRRQFLQLMGASLAMAGLAGCRSMPEDKIVPYVKLPEEMVPGNPLSFATAMPLGADAIGLLVESREGRPVKIEGNPRHPNSLGRTDAFAQASILTLYDPDRSQIVRNLGEPSSWDAFLSAVRPVLARQRAAGGAGVRLLTETVTSPTLGAQIRGFLARYPAARWHQYEPGGPSSAREGARLAFGSYVNPVYRFDRARVILSLDADFLLTMPGHVRYAHDFMNGRRVRADRTTMNRLYVAESTYTITGAMADHRMRMRSRDVEGFARAVADAVRGAGGAAPAGVPAAAFRALVADLQANRGASVVVAGDDQPPAVHALAHAINGALGNAGQTVVYTDPVEEEPGDQMASLRTLADDLDAGRVELLIILGGNPVYNAPADLRLAERLTASAGDRDRVPFRVRLGLYEDETSAVCNWHLPEAHYLEAWGDARAFDGTVSIIQPLIAPLYEGRSAIEVMASLAEQPRAAGYDVVRGYWQGQRPGAGFDAFWERTLNEGYVRNSALPARQVAVRPDFVAGAGVATAAAAPEQGLEIVFRLDPTIWDGRWANNAWLQELPKPLTKLCWDNAALMSAETARELGLAEEDLVELRYRGNVVLAPVWVQPGHAERSVTVHLGGGRSVIGSVGAGAGFNANLIRTADAPGFGTGLEIRKTGRKYGLAVTQHHHTMATAGGSGEEHGRDIVRVANIEDYRRSGGHVGRDGAHHVPEQMEAGEHATGMQPQTPAGGETAAHPPLPSLYPEEMDNFVEQGYAAWAMIIDQNTCIGCNACVVACQSENNIPVVGKKHVMKGREMHWIRIDRYHRGGLDDPEAYFQPLTCMHCEKAPCEPVCPVAATVHSHEGLNMMVYNRCIGTRYCSNNCPYKVRRFNFLKWTAGKGGSTLLNFDLPVLQMVNNPEVTVRGRGVMEKCTYCVQRINRVRIQAKQEDRDIRDGEIIPACAQSCPTDAIVFGDINDPNSRISQLRRQPHNYGLLTELNTQPRTTYLARLRNPNAAIPGANTESEAESHGGTNQSGH